MSLAWDKNRHLDELREKAEAFRAAMIESGAVHKVSENLYMPQLRALERALNPMNYTLPE